MTGNLTGRATEPDSGRVEMSRKWEWDMEKSISKRVKLIPKTDSKREIETNP